MPTEPVPSLIFFERATTRFWLLSLLSIVFTVIMATRFWYVVCVYQYEKEETHSLNCRGVLAHYILLKGEAVSQNRMWSKTTVL